MECLQWWYIRKGLGTRNSKLQAPVPQKKKKQCTYFLSLVRATEKRPTSGVSGCTWYIYIWKPQGLCGESTLVKGEWDYAVMMSVVTM